jgi:hypothetical protein
VTEPNAKFRIAARATPAEGRLLLDWMAGSRACEVAYAHTLSLSSERIWTQAEANFEVGVRLLAAGQISYGQFNTRRAGGSTAASRQLTAVGSGGGAASGGRPGNGLPPNACGANDAACYYRQQHPLATEYDRPLSAGGSAPDRPNRPSQVPGYGAPSSVPGYSAQPSSGVPGYSNSPGVPGY